MPGREPCLLPFEVVSTCRRFPCRLPANEWLLPIGSSGKGSEMNKCAACGHLSDWHDGTIDGTCPAYLCKCVEDIDATARERDAEAAKKQRDSIEAWPRSSRLAGTSLTEVARQAADESTRQNLPRHEGCRHPDSRHEPVSGRCRAHGCDCIHETPALVPHPSNPLPPIDHEARTQAWLNSLAEANRTAAPTEEWWKWFEVSQLEETVLRQAKEIEDLRRKLQDLS